MFYLKETKLGSLVRYKQIYHKEAKTHFHVCDHQGSENHQLLKLRNHLKPVLSIG